jgi:hypothetical protein
MKISCLDYASIVIAATLFIGVPLADASAQTATDLKCRGCVGKKDIGKKAVKSRHIKNGSVKGKDLKDATVETSKLSDGAVTADKLATGAKPTGYAETNRDGEQPPLSTTASAVVSVSLNAPTDGYAYVTGEGLFHFLGAANAAACNVTPGTTHSFDIGGGGSGNNASENAYMGYSGTRVYPVVAGANTFNLVCLTMNAEDVTMINPRISALFVPNQY